MSLCKANRSKLEETTSSSLGRVHSSEAGKETTSSSLARGHSSEDGRNQLILAWASPLHLNWERNTSSSLGRVNSSEAGKETSFPAIYERTIHLSKQLRQLSFSPFSFCKVQILFHHFKYVCCFHIMQFSSAMFYTTQIIFIMYRGGHSNIHLF